MSWAERDRVDRRRQPWRRAQRAGELRTVTAPIEEIITGFHVALDRGLPAESLPDELAEDFRAWVEEHYPEIYERADKSAVEGYLIDESEGIEPIVANFQTVPEQHLRGIFQRLRDRIHEFYSNTELDPDDELHAAALATLAHIDAYLSA
jgi:hypothetical protein